MDPRIEQIQQQINALQQQLASIRGSAPATPPVVQQVTAPVATPAATPAPSASGFRALANQVSAQQQALVSSPPPGAAPPLTPAQLEQQRIERLSLMKEYNATQATQQQQTDQQQLEAQRLEQERQAAIQQTQARQRADDERRLLADQQRITSQLASLRSR
jgi:hypothetical protein